MAAIDDSLLLEKLDQIDDLPSLPGVVLRLESAIRDPNNGAKEIAAIIEGDPAVVARVLKIANSAFYQTAGSKVGSVQQAVARLGLREIRRLCFTIATVGLFARQSPTIDYLSFWNHAVTTAETTRSIALRARKPDLDPDDAYVVGLLHELGAMILDQYFSRVYSAVAAEAKRAQRPIHLTEYEYLRADHAEVGAVLLERWRLPEATVAAVRFHHDPNGAPEASRLLAQVVYLADLCCTMHHIPGPGEETLVGDDPRAWEQLGLRDCSVVSMFDLVRADAERCAPLIDLYGG